MNESVDLGKHRHGPGEDDGRDRGDEREPRHDDLVARADAETEQRHEQAARATAVQAQAVAHARERGDLLLDMADLGPEPRVVLPPVAAERSVGEDLHDLGDLFLADQLDAGSGHAGSPFLRVSCATDCTAPYQHDNLTVNIGC